MIASLRDWQLSEGTDLAAVMVAPWQMCERIRWPSWWFEVRFEGEETFTLTSNLIQSNLSLNRSLNLNLSLNLHLCLNLI